MRLNLFLAKAGIASRRKADQLIAAGKIKVNHEMVTVMGTKIDPKRDLVEFNDRKVSLAERLVYYAVNKPKGVVSSTASQNQEIPIVSLVPKTPQVFPVGRLDKSAQGLIILTNDGTMAYKLSHPKFDMTKTYIVTLDKVPSEKQILELRQGIILKEGKTATAEITRNLNDHSGKQLVIKLHQGYYHQIKRMADRVGLTVREIIRTQLGPIDLDLPTGKYRQLSETETAKLKQVVGD